MSGTRSRVPHDQRTSRSDDARSVLSKAARKNSRLPRTAATARAAMSVRRAQGVERLPARALWTVLIATLLSAPTPVCAAHMRTNVLMRNARRPHVHARRIADVTAHNLVRARPPPSRTPPINSQAGSIGMPTNILNHSSNVPTLIRRTNDPQSCERTM